MKSTSTNSLVGFEEATQTKAIRASLNISDFYHSIDSEIAQKCVSNSSLKMTKSHPSRLRILKGIKLCLNSEDKYVLQVLKMHRG